MSFFVAKYNQGTCQDSKGKTPSGMTQLADVTDKEQCFKACSDREGTTGCQYVSPDLSDVSCWVFTGEVAKGSGRPGQKPFTCWTFGGMISIFH